MPVHHSLDVLVHKLSMKLVPEAVVDEGNVLVVWLGPGAVLEHNVVVPALLDLHVGLGAVAVLLLEERVAR